MKHLFILISLLGIQSAWATDWEGLCKEGYAVKWKSSISGEFNGCDYGKAYRLDNGLVFKCSEYHYSYSYSPDFYLLINVHGGSSKYIIESEAFEGELYK